MPIFEYKYKCQDCGKTFELCSHHASAIKPPACASCGFMDAARALFLRRPLMNDLGQEAASARKHRREIAVTVLTRATPQVGLFQQPDRGGLRPALTGALTFAGRSHYALQHIPKTVHWTFANTSPQPCRG